MEVFGVSADYGEGFHVQCSVCCMFGPLADTREEAIECWNALMRFPAQFS